VAQTSNADRASGSARSVPHPEPLAQQCQERTAAILAVAHPVAWLGELGAPAELLGGLPRPSCSALPVHGFSRGLKRRAGPISRHGARRAGEDHVRAVAFSQPPAAVMRSRVLRSQCSDDSARRLARRCIHGTEERRSSCSTARVGQREYVRGSGFDCHAGSWLRNSHSCGRACRSASSWERTTR